MDSFRHEGNPSPAPPRGASSRRRGRFGLVLLAAVVCCVGSGPVAAAERSLVPMRPIDRPYPAIDWCQIQDLVYFQAPGCTVFVDFAV